MHCFYKAGHVLDFWPLKIKHSATHFLAKIFSDDLLDLLHGAFRSFAVQHLQRCGVLFRQQVIQSAQVLADLDEGSPVGTTQVPQTLGRP